MCYFHLVILTGGFLYVILFSLWASFCLLFHAILGDHKTTNERKDGELKWKKNCNKLKGKAIYVALRASLCTLVLAFRWNFTDSSLHFVYLCCSFFFSSKNISLTSPPVNQPPSWNLFQLMYLQFSQQSSYIILFFLDSMSSLHLNLHFHFILNFPLTFHKQILIFSNLQLAFLEYYYEFKMMMMMMWLHHSLYSPAPSRRLFFHTIRQSWLCRKY